MAAVSSSCPRNEGCGCCVIAYRNQLGGLAQYTQRMAALPWAYARPRKSTARYAVEQPTHGKALQTPRMVASV
ncbi:hypothetical protein ACWM9A_10915 [Acetobacter pasteurianus]